MEINELYLKTAFCCMACDGDIADEEVQYVRDLSADGSLFRGVDVESKINKWVEAINAEGSKFLNTYLEELAATTLTDEQQMTIVDLAIKMIEADNQILYSEVKFFKKIRVRLTLTDEAILAKHPDKEEFLRPDLNVFKAPEWDDTVHFDQINLK